MWRSYRLDDRGRASVIALLSAALVGLAACSGPTRSALPPDTDPDLRRLARDCDGDDLAACLVVGRAWYQGEGLPTNMDLGIALIQSACSADVEGACDLLEITRLPARPSSRAVARAQSCDRRELRACGQLAELYRTGEGVPAAPADAARIHESACERGFADSCHARYEMIWAGEGEPTDADRAVAYLHQACQLGRAESCDISFEISFGEGASDAALIEARSCDRGDPAACVTFGRALRSGDGARMNLAGARQAFAQGCDGGAAYGCVEAARMWSSLGIGDDDRAAEFYTRACDAELPAACAEFGTVLYDRAATWDDFARVYQLWERACALGDPSGCEATPGPWESRLAPSAAADARREARRCDQAEALACGSLADRMATAAGVARDLDASISLHTRACLLGDSGACPDARFDWPCSIESTDATGAALSRDEFRTDVDGQITAYRRIDSATGEVRTERRYAPVDGGMLAIEARRAGLDEPFRAWVPTGWDPIPLPPAAAAYRGPVGAPWWSFVEIDIVRAWHLESWRREHEDATIGDPGDGGERIATSGALTARFHESGRLLSETDGDASERRAHWGSTGNLLRLSWFDPNSSGGYDVRYNDGRIAEIQDTRVEMRDRSSSMLYEFTTDGRLAGVVVSSTEATGRGRQETRTWTVIYTYDRAGNPTDLEVLFDGRPSETAHFDYSCYTDAAP